MQEIKLPNIAALLPPEPDQNPVVFDSTHNLQRVFNSLGACFLPGAIATVSLLVVAWNVSLHYLIQPQGKYVEVLGFVEPALWTCLSLVILVLAIFAFHRPKALHFDSKGLFITTKLVDGFSSQQYVAWSWLTGATVVQYGLICKEPRIQFRTKWGTTCSISLKQVKASMTQDSLISALKTWAPHIVSSVENYVAADQADYTRLWLSSLTGSCKRQRTNFLTVGTSLNSGKYKIAGRVGAGGQGTAYLAAQEGSGQSVVLKEYIFPLHKGTRVADLTGSRLHHEATVLRNIKHESIVELLDCFVEDYRGYLVLEYIEGDTLKHLVEKFGPLPEAQVAEMAHQIADVLNYLHRLSPPVVHRDLTPDNLILQPDGKIKLVDFNVAHQLLSSDNSATIVGKHAYIPPEQFRGKPTAQSDIYAFGGTLFFLLTGEDPEPMSVSRPKSVKPEVSKELDELIAHATAIDEKLRYGNVGVLRDDLLKMAVRK